MVILQPKIEYLSPKINLYANFSTILSSFFNHKKLFLYTLNINFDEILFFIKTNHADI